MPVQKRRSTPTQTTSSPNAGISIRTWSRKRPPGLLFQQVIPTTYLQHPHKATISFFLPSLSLFHTHSLCHRANLSPPPLRSLRLHRPTPRPHEHPHDRRTPDNEFRHQLPTHGQRSRERLRGRDERTFHVAYGRAEALLSEASRRRLRRRSGEGDEMNK